MWREPSTQEARRPLRPATLLSFPLLSPRVPRHSLGRTLPEKHVHTPLLASMTTQGHPETPPRSELVRMGGSLPRLPARVDAAVGIPSAGVQAPNPTQGPSCPLCGVHRELRTCSFTVTSLPEESTLTSF